MTALLCTLLSAAGFYFSLGLAGQWWLLWLAPLPVLWLAYRGARQRTVWLTCWASVTLGLSNTIPVYWGSLPPVIVGMIVLLPGLGFAGVTVLSLRIKARISPAAGTLAFAALWTSLDYLLSLGANGTAPSWAYSQMGEPVLVQSASLFGIWAIDFVFGAFVSGLAMTLAAGTPWPSFAGAILFAANAAFGAARLEAVPPMPVTQVGLAAWDRMAFLKHNPAALASALDAYSVAAARLAPGRPSLLVFPEKIAVMRGPGRLGAITQLQRVAGRTHATIVMGFDDESTSPPHNTALIAGPDGAVHVYNKRHMVPGLEDKFAIGGGGLILPGRIGVAICKDMDFPQTLRADASRLRPTLLAVPAWDFGGDGWWHARLAMMRGVENGFALARSAKDGLLTASDAYGRLIAITPSGKAGMALLSAAIPRGPGPTLYTAIGDVLAWFSLALSAALLAWPVRTRKSS